MAFVVSKFGGTSMGNAECMLRSADVAHQQKSNLIVVSATSGTTNLLLQIGAAAENQSWGIVVRPSAVAPMKPCVTTTEFFRSGISSF